MLTFNHPKCEKIGNRIYNLIRHVTPDFRFNIILKTVRFSNILSPKLKAQIRPRQAKSISLEWLDQTNNLRWLGLA